MPSKEFHDLLDKARIIHDRKNHDYAQEDNPFSNFQRAAEIVSWFENDIDKVFVTLIGVKLARLAELCNGKEAKNESVDDTGLDLFVYCGLWQAYRGWVRN